MANRYLLDRTPEIDRLERQAALIGIDRVRDHLPDVDSRAVLDAGCGSGWASRLIARERPRARVTGIDLTADFVGYADARARDEGLDNLSHLVGDVTALPFPADSFDFVWSQLVLFFVPEPDRAVAEFVRVLKPGGGVKISVTDVVFGAIWPERPALSEGLRALREDVMHGWRMARVPQMFRDAGLRDITVETAVDRVYSFTGGASPAQRLNIEESYLEAIRARPDAVGGKEAAERLVTDLIDFIDDPESVALNTHWTFGGTKPR